MHGFNGLAWPCPLEPKQGGSLDAYVSWSLLPYLIEGFFSQYTSLDGHSVTLPLLNAKPNLYSHNGYEEST